MKIGIIGYLTPETKFLAPRNDVEYEDEIVAIRREAKKLKGQGVNILIALGHSGFIKDLEIARDVEDIDLVIGGHSNTFLWNANTTSEKPEIPQGPYPTVVEQPSGRLVRVVQAYAYTKYLGKLNLIFDSNGEIVECDGIPILLDHYVSRDPAVLDIVNKYRGDVDRINKEVVGSSLVFLNGEDCRLRECNIGDLISKAMLNYTKQYFNSIYPNVNIAIIQGGRIRTSITYTTAPTQLTRGDWITVLPFSDTLTIVTMNGSVLKQSLEHSISTWRTIDSTGQFLQFSGMKVVYDLAKPPGSRLVSAKATCSNCDQYKLVDVKDHYEYRVIMPSFLAGNGDGYTMFEGLPMELLAYNELECVLKYLSVYSPVDDEVDGRIIIMNEDKVMIPNIMNNINTPGNNPNSAIRFMVDSTFKLYHMFWLLIILQNIYL